MIRPRLALAAFLAAAATGLPAAAQIINPTVIWTGAVNNNWSTGGNYTPPTADGPAAGQDIVGFNNTSTRLTTNIWDLNRTYVGLVILNNVTGPVTINSAGTTKGLDFGGIDMSIANQNLTLNPQLNVAANHGWVVAAGRTLTLNGGVTTFGASRAVTVNFNPAAGAGTQGTTGTVVLGGAGAFGAGSTMTVRNGILQLNNTAALNGLSGSGLTLDPLDSDNNTGTIARAVVALNNVGTVNVPLTLSSGGTGLRGTLRSTAGTGNTWGGSVTVNGGAAAVHEFDAGNASTLVVSGGVAGPAFAGTLQLRSVNTATGLTGTGTGRLNNTVLLAANATLTKLDSGGVWEVNSGGTWGATNVSAGTLRVGANNALPTAARVVLGQPNATASERVGTLDLNGFNQQVGGLGTASSNTEVNPNLNRIGVGNSVAGPLQSILTYNRTAGAETFDGTLVDSLPGVAGYTLGLTLDAGDLTLRSANTYTGPTIINGTSTLRLATLTTGSFTNHGSIAGSQQVVLNSGTAGLNVTGLTGGLSFDVVSGRFAPAANQTVRGLGTVTGNVAVPLAAAVRGGTTATPTGTLTVAGNLLFRGDGGAFGLTGGRYAVDLGGAAASGATVGRIAVTGAGNVVDFQNASGPVNIPLFNDQNLALFTPYSFNIGSAAGGYRLNTATTIPPGTSYTYGTDFVITSARNDVFGFHNVSLTPDAGNNLILSFTPVPEPAAVLGLAAAGLAAVRLGRRRILAG